MINNFEVTHFKCLSKSKIHFRKLTVFAGSNSVGKSSVIQAILISRITIQKLIQYNLLNADVAEGNIQVPLNGKYMLQLGNTQEVLTRDAESNIIHFKINNTDLKTAINLNYEAEDTRTDFYNLKLIGDWAQIGNFEELKEEFYYLNAERLGPRITYDMEQFDYVHVGWQGEYAIQVLAQNKEITIENSQRKFFETTDLKLISQVRAWMNFIIPDFYIDDADLDGKLKKAYTTFSNSTPTNVGFGISYVLPIVVNGLVAKGDTMFIIENPEAHLHPKGQSNIGFFLGQLASTGLQVVIETHSEHVINGIRKYSLSGKQLSPKDVLINFFDKSTKPGEITISQIEVKESGDLSDFPLDFFDQVQQDMAEIFKLKLSQ
jgi:predicted ATPase